MIGAIVGDIIGSVYENFRTKRKDFRLFTPVSTFTDDTVLTVAVADAILESTNFEDAIRNAVSLGGDADTQACIAGAIAEAYYKAIPPYILRQVRRRTSRGLWKKAMEFSRVFGIKEIVEQLNSLDAE